jgi:diacylglycerol kinase family enzyme
MILYNPIAGAGRAAAAAESLESPLRQAGHDLRLDRTPADPPADWLDAELDDVGALVVVGGDGTVRLASGPAVRTGTPLYHFPLGTENLFARELGFDDSIPRLLQAIDRGRVRCLDVGVVEGQPFLLMTSMGFDAGVVHRLASRRVQSITHLSYLPPILNQLLRWRPSRLTVRVEHEVVVDDEPGFVVVANSPQYAVRLNPAADASMTDGVLDVVFFPCRSSLAMLRWMLACRLGRQVRDPRLVYRKGKQISLRSATPRPYQLDGDLPDDRSSVSELHFTLQPGVLPVLDPVKN